MSYKILSEPGTKKIILSYKNGNSLTVKTLQFKYMDSKECYFVMDFFPGFVKPKHKTPAEIEAYTDNGVYKANVQILDTSISLNNITVVLSVPTKMDYIQLRLGERKPINASVNIKFNDGFEINSQTKDISFGGVSFFTEKNIPDLYKRFPALLTLNFSAEYKTDFLDNKLTIQAKFAREFIEDGTNRNLCVFKFINLSGIETTLLKKFILNLN